MERIQLENERKEKKKQKDKERKERLKAEGKLLTAKQKLDKQRADAMLDDLKARGIEVPEPGIKKPRPGTRIRPNKKSQQAANQTTSEEKEDATAGESVASQDGQTTQETSEASEVVVEKVKDSWDATSSEDEDSEMAEPESAKPTSDASNKQATHSKQTAQKKPQTPDENDSEASDESDEDSDSDESGDESEDTRTDAEKKKEKAWERIMVRHTSNRWTSTKSDFTLFFSGVFFFTIETSARCRAKTNHGQFASGSGLCIGSCRYG